MSIEALVQEDQIDQAIMENERLLCSYELQKKSPNALALVLIALQEEALVSEYLRALACHHPRNSSEPAVAEYCLQL